MAGFLTVLLSIIVSLKQDTLIGILFMTTTNLGKTEKFGLGLANSKSNSPLMYLTLENFRTLKICYP